MKSSKVENNNEILGRELEIQQLIEYVNSPYKQNQSILHIVGQPGTGKTLTVNYVLQTYSEGDFEYINYFTCTTSPYKQIRHQLNTLTVIVIDEFDKYYNEKRRECHSCMVWLSKHKVKLITISNNLRMMNQRNMIRFKPYTSEILGEIISKRLLIRETDESTKENKQSLRKDKIIFENENVVKFISKKYAKIGDIRELEKFIEKLVIYKESRNNKLSIITLSDINTVNSQVLEIRDNLLPNNNNKNIHHKLIVESKENNNNNNNNKKLQYNYYLKECKELNISNLDRNEFNIIYEMYK